MKGWTSKWLALPAVALAVGTFVLPASAQYYNYYSDSAYGPSYVESYPTYVQSTTSYPSVIEPTYVSPEGYYRDGPSPLGSAAAGAGIGALGGLVGGAVFGRGHHLGRDAGIGAGIGGGLGLLRGLSGY